MNFTRIGKSYFIRFGEKYLALNIRYVIPKGRSLDGLTREKVGLLFSHINSYVRGSNENRTPYDLMAARFGEGFMEAIGVKRIPAKDVLLKPSLLK